MDMLKSTLAFISAVAADRAAHTEDSWELEFSRVLGDVMGRKFHCNPLAVADEMRQLMKTHTVSIPTLVEFIELEIWLDEIPNLWEAL